ncbi:MAG: HEAT repeat domain-containing protein [Acidimicrobiia bacterium]|nr:HEAT repeat domain-containing protein [Acidimicrobiia bacterium]
MTAPTGRAVAAAGHLGDAETARSGLESADPSVRAIALGALERLGALTDDALTAALADCDPMVRRRAAEVAATHPQVDLTSALDDRDASVIEVAAWACGEHEHDRLEIVDRLISLARAADDALVREAAVAALGAIGSGHGLPAILAATTDKPAVRRRAVLALAPFDGLEVEAAIDRALDDRDWQVRQAAEDQLTIIEDASRTDREDSETDG